MGYVVEVIRGANSQRIRELATISSRFTAWAAKKS
ncbi:hypothetical protein ACNKHQ_22550 [Shigella flexneri]